jgi:hypothetical protein
MQSPSATAETAVWKPRMDVSWSHCGDCMEARQPFRHQPRA